MNYEIKYGDLGSSLIKNVTCSIGGGECWRCVKCGISRGYDSNKKPESICENKFRDRNWDLIADQYQRKYGKDSKYETGQGIPEEELERFAFGEMNYAFENDVYIICMETESKWAYVAPTAISTYDSDFIGMWNELASLKEKSEMEQNKDLKNEMH